jgi:hypothetical protein
MYEKIEAKIVWDPADIFIDFIYIRLLAFGSKEKNQKNIKRMFPNPSATDFSVTYKDKKASKKGQISMYTLLYVQQQLWSNCHFLLLHLQRLQNFVGVQSLMNPNSSILTYLKQNLVQDCLLELLQRHPIILMLGSDPHLNLGLHKLGGTIKEFLGFRSNFVF